MIYGQLLLIPGAIYPVATEPISVTSQYKYKSAAERAALVAPRSVLDLLLVNHQIHDEACGIFYQNDLVFPTPARLLAFVVSLGNKRLESLTSLTLFNKCGYLIDQGERREGGSYRHHPYISYRTFDERALEGMDKMEVTKLLINRLPNLQKLHFIHRNRTMRGIGPEHAASTNNKQCDLQFADTRFMFEMRNISDIEVRDLDLEINGYYGGGRNLAAVNRNKASLKHLNHGLRLAQKGIVVRELYADRNWRKDETWPVLQDSDCGVSRGCTCGPEK